MTSNVCTQVPLHGKALAAELEEGLAHAARRQTADQRSFSQLLGLGAPPSRFPLDR